VWPFDLLYDIDPRIPDRFTGDVNRLGQILTNLLSNACKFTNNGEVALRIYMDNSGPANRPHVVFQIRDTGIGIAAGQLNRIFTPFYQVPLVSRAGFAGTGLGLAIVKKVVEQLEGEISVESTPGIGTTFSVSVPLAPSDEGLSEREAPIESAKSIVVFGEQTPSLLFFLEAFKRYHPDVQHFEPKSISVARKGLLIGKDAAVVWNDASPNVQWLQELVGAAKAAGVPLAAVSPPGDLTRLDLLRSLGIGLVLNTPVSVDDVLIAIRGNSCKPAPSLPSASKSRESQRRSMNVLVADDIPTNSYILSSLLENLGHTVEVVTNGVELLNRLRPVAAGSTAAPPVDLVLTDIQMPLMDGDVAVKRIRLIEGCAGSQHIPIIGVTARALPEEVASLKVAGLDHVLVKPVEEDDLLRLLSVYTGSASDVGRDTQAVQPSEEALVALVSAVAQEAGPITDDQGANHELLDARAIFKRSGKSVGKTRTILGAFAASYAQVRESIQRCAVQRDEVGLERSIHSLKGLLLDVGAYVPLDAIEAFEHSTKNGQSAERMSSDDFIADLLKQIDRVAILATRVQTELAGQQENETPL
jgi:CheY-like chemotaxis protein